MKFAAQVNQCELGKPKRQIKDAPCGKEDMDVVKEMKEKTSVASSRTTGSSKTAVPSTPSAGSKRPRTTPASTASTARSKSTR